MTPPDPLDRDIAAGLRGLAAEGDDTEAALAGVRPRARRARRQRQARGIGGAAAVVAVALTVGVLTTGSDDADRVATPGTRPSTSTSGASTTTATTDTTVAPGTTVTAPDGSPVTTPDGTPVTTPDGTPVTTPGTTPTPTSEPGVTPPGATNPTNPTTPPTTPTPGTTAPVGNVDQQVFSSNSGSITVRLENNALSLVAVTPAPGFTPEIRDNTSERVRVRFDDGEDHEDVEVRLVDGKMVQVDT